VIPCRLCVCVRLRHEYTQRYASVAVRRCVCICLVALFVFHFNSTLLGLRPQVQQIHSLISLFLLFSLCLPPSCLLLSSPPPLSLSLTLGSLAFSVPKSNNALTHHFTLKCCKNMHKAFGPSRFSVNVQDDFHKSNSTSEFHCC